MDSVFWGRDEKGGKGRKKERKKGSGRVIVLLNRELSKDQDLAALSRIPHCQLLLLVEQTVHYPPASTAYHPSPSFPQEGRKKAKISSTHATVYHGPNSLSHGILGKA